MRFLNYENLFLNRLLFVIFQVDAELNKELEQWNEMLRNDAVKLCQENNFNTGFFEGSDNNCVVDAYELKVMILFKTWDTSLVCSWYVSSHLTSHL